MMKMATGKKEPMKIKRCVEFYQMLRLGETETKKHSKKWNREGNKR